MREEEILRQIDRYLTGKLSEKEIDQLWAEFLKEPAYLEWLEIEAGAREVMLKIDEGGPLRESDNRKNSRISGIQDHWKMAAAGVLAAAALAWYVSQSL